MAKVVHERCGFRSWVDRPDLGNVNPSEKQFPIFADGDVVHERAVVGELVDGGHC